MNEFTDTQVHLPQEEENSSTAILYKRVFAVFMH